MDTLELKITLIHYHFNLQYQCLKFIHFIFSNYFFLEFHFNRKKKKIICG